MRMEHYKINTDKDLLKNLDKLHTTKLGIKRIKRNLSLDTDDVVGWPKTKFNCQCNSYKKREKLVYQCRSSYYNGKCV